MILTIILAFLFIFFIPDRALAWGPATHLEIGETIIRHAVVISPAVRELILKFPHDFLYGNISADIVVGKNLVEELKHCHHWKNGFKLLDKAKTGCQKAFAYGYLSHLAADTVAHNHFIPEMMIRSFSARTLRHAYWELRFDALADKGVWRMPKRMIKNIHRENDRLLETILEDTPLSFRTNKTIFSSLMILNRVEHWHRMLYLLSKSTRWTLGKETKEKFFNDSLDSVIDVLNHAHEARCIKKDPTGRRSLNAAKFVRKKLKTSRRQGQDWQESMEKALNWVRM